MPACEWTHRVVLKRISHYTGRGRHTCRAREMPLNNLLPWIFVAIVASIAAMVTGVSSDLPRFSWVAAVLFAVALIATAIDVNRPWWRHGEMASDPNAPAAAAVRNARLVMLGYLWGALALFAIYRLTALRWQHGLQYAGGMGAIAWLIW